MLDNAAPDPNARSSARRRPLRRQFASLRFALLLLVLLAVLPAIGYFVYAAQRQRDEALETARTSYPIIVEVESARYSDPIIKAEQLLGTLANGPAIVDRIPDQCNRFVANLWASHPEYTGMGVADVNGTIWCSTHPQFIGTRTGANGLALLEKIRANPAFTIGEFLIGAQSGTPILSLGYPVRDAAGNFQGILSTGIDLSQWKPAERSPLLPQSAALAILHRNGKVLFHSTDRARVGTDVRTVPLVDRAVRSTAVGTAEGTGIGGQDRLAAFGPLMPGGPEGLYVIYESPRNDAYAAANAALVRNLASISAAGLIILAILLIGSELMIFRRTRRLVRVAQRLGEGDFTVRTGIKDEPGEIGDLARVFDAMAGGLQQREEVQRVAEQQRADLIREHAARSQAERDRRMAEFRAHAGRVLASSLDYRESLKEVARLAPEVALGSYVMLADDAGKLNIHVASHSDPKLAAVIEEAHRKYPPADETSLSYRAFHSGKTQVNPRDSDEKRAGRARSEEHLRMMRALGPVATIAAPITAHGQTYGTFGLLIDPDRQSPDEGYVRLAEDIANRIGLAIHSSRAYEAEKQALAKAEEARARAELLARASAELASTIDYRDAIKAVARLVIPMLGDGVYINEVDDHGKLVFLTAAHVDPVKHAASEKIQTTYPKDGRSLSFKAMSTGQTQTISKFDESEMRNLAEDEEHLRLLKVIGDQSLIVAPMKAHGRVLGTLGLSLDPVRRTFDESYVSLCEDLAARMGLAIQSSRAFEAQERSRDQADRARRRAEFLARADQVLASSVDYRTSLAQVGRMIVPEMATACYVMLADAAGELHLATAAHADPRKSSMLEDMFREYPPDEHSLAMKAFRTGQTQVLESVPDTWIQEVARDVRHLETLKSLGVPKAWLAAPIAAQGNRYGAVGFLLDPDRLPLEAGLIGLLEDLAGRIGMALFASNAFELEQAARQESEAARKRAEFRARAGRSLASSLDFEAALQSVTRLIVPEIADGVYVNLAGEDGRLKFHSVVHIDPVKEANLEKVQRTYPKDETSLAFRAFRSGKVQVNPKVTDEHRASIAKDDEHLRLMRSIGDQATVVAPIVAQGETYGTFGLLLDPARQPVDDGYVGMVEDFASMIGQALNVSRAYQSERRALAASEAARRRADFLARAGRLLSSTLDYRKALGDVLNVAVPEVADGAYAYLMDSSGRVFMSSVAHVDSEKAALMQGLSKRWPVDPDNNLGAYEVMKSGRGRLHREITDEMLERVAQDEEHLAALKSLGNRSSIVAPIAAHGRTFGVLALVTGPSGQSYGEEDLKLAEDLAARCGLAVYSSMVYEAEQEDRRNADLLARAGRVLSSSMDYEQSFREIAGLTVPEIADYFTAYLIADDGNVSPAVVMAHDPEKQPILEVIARRYTARPDNRSSTDSLESGLAAFHPDITGEALRKYAVDEEHLQLLHRLELGSAIVAPMFAQGVSHGWITVSRGASSPRFNENDLKTIEDLATRFGLAVHMSKTFRAEQVARERAEASVVRRTAMRQISLALMDASEFDVPLQRVLESLGSNLDWDLGAVWVQDRPGGEMRRAAYWHRDAGLAGRVPVTVLPTGAGVEAEALATQKPVWLSDIWGKRQDGVALPDYTDIHGKVMVPARTEGGVLGLLALWSRRIKPVDQEGAIFLETLGNELGQFIERVRTSELVRQLSTPVLPIAERLLLVPIVGRITAPRAAQMVDKVLASVQVNRARVIVVDVTGVALMDALVADRLLYLIQTARLLGARTVLTGVSTEVSATLVSLGVDISNLETTADLRAGIERATMLVQPPPSPRPPKDRNALGATGDKGSGSHNAEQGPGKAAGSGGNRTQEGNGGPRPGNVPFRPAAG